MNRSFRSGNVAKRVVLDAKPPPARFNANRRYSDGRITGSRRQACIVEGIVN